MPTDRSRLALCVDVLGPLTLRVHGEQVAVPGDRRRALLALLALEKGRTVSTERLIDSLWPEDPPAHAVHALYNHVSRLRGHLGPLASRLERYGAGYRLQLGTDEVDAEAARRLARAAGSPGTTPEEAEKLLRAALELWRGPALEEFLGIPAVAVVAVGLDELRLQLVDDLTQLRLRRGDVAVAVDAASAAAEAPLRERSTLLLVEALAAAGRSAEAMTAASEFRRRLNTETGLDPGPALAELEQRVARGALDASRTSGEPADGNSVGSRLGAPPDGPMVGRQHDRAEVLRLLADHSVITLTGPGGVGKTRLALDVAANPAAHPAEGEGGETVVADLAAVDRPERVCQAVGSTFRLRDTDDTGPDGVAAALRGRRLLLVLDNCEHVAEACRDLVATLRRRAPGVRVLATSRTTLHLPGEHVVRLQPLPVPHEVRDLDTLRRQPAVRAFLEHARRRLPDYDLTEADRANLVEVLRRLDGLPLAIELAARQVAVMPLRAVRDRLDRVLDLATGHPPAADDRQRTLRATIESSYRLLAAHEQELLRAVAPFPGGVDLATVEILGRLLPADPLDVLHRLVDGSLLVADSSAGRYRLLFTVRAFLLEELRRLGELDRAEKRFVERCFAIAREIENTSAGPDEPQVDRRLRAELDNLRAARDVAGTHGWEHVRLGIAAAVSDAARCRDLREPWLWALESVEERGPEDDELKLAVLSCAAEGARLMGDLGRATALAEEVLDRAGPQPDPAVVDRAWSAWASAAHFRGDFASARAGWLRAAAQGRPAYAGGHLASAALAAAYDGDHDGARTLLDRAYSAARSADSASQMAFAAYVDGELRTGTSDEEALALYERAIDGARRSGATFVEGVSRVALASAQMRLRDVAAAAEELRSLLESWERSGHTTQLWTTARNAAFLLAQQGRPRPAALLLVCADEQPGAAAVSRSIARHSGRLFVPLEDVLDENEVGQVRAEVGKLGPPGVLAAARHALAEVARS